MENRAMAADAAELRRLTTDVSDDASHGQRRREKASTSAAAFVAVRERSDGKRGLDSISSVT